MMNEQQLQQVFYRMIEEDAPHGDLTLKFTPNKNVTAKIIAREKGFISGITEIKTLFKLFNIKTTLVTKDGKPIKKNQTVLKLAGKAHSILLVERTALNILSRMSGVTTATKKYTSIRDKLKAKTRIAATRKTTPLFRYFEKKAVEVGGGDTHRMGLSDCVMIKDNHLQLFKNASTALDRAREETSFTHKIEVEVSNKRDALTAASKADILMLDNMKPTVIRSLASEIRQINPKIILEASGNITLENLKDYLGSGVDVLSIGRLTYDVKPLDYGLEVL